MVSKIFQNGRRGTSCLTLNTFNVYFDQEGVRFQQFGQLQGIGNFFRRIKRYQKIFKMAATGLPVNCVFPIFSFQGNILFFFIILFRNGSKS